MLKVSYTSCGEQFDKEMCIILEGTRQNNEKQQKQGGSMTEWSARQTRNPAVPGSKVVMEDTFFTSPAGDWTATLRGHPSQAKV